LYPALIFYDLAGMGGYDGFASPAMMVEYGAWASTSGSSLVYTLFNITYFLWLLSLVNIPIAVGISLKLLRDRNR
jgi:hypothetical protein